MRGGTRETLSTYLIMVENKDILYCTVGKIVARKYCCPFCADLVKSALSVASLGPEKFLQKIVAHQGMICNSVEWMMEEASKALNTIEIKS